MAVLGARQVEGIDVAGGERDAEYLVLVVGGVHKAGAVDLHDVDAAVLHREGDFVDGAGNAWDPELAFGRHGRFAHSLSNRTIVARRRVNGHRTFEHVFDDRPHVGNGAVAHQMR